MLEKGARVKSQGSWAASVVKEDNACPKEVIGMAAPSSTM